MSLSGLLAAPATLLLFVADHARTLTRNRAALKYSEPALISAFGLSDSQATTLSNLTARRPVEFRLEGRRENAIDDGGALYSSVRAIRVPRTAAASSAVVLIPAIYVLRFAGQPQAMAALLAHEVAHHINRDIVLLSGLQRLISVVTIAGGGFFILQLLAAARADVAAGASWSIAVWAAAVGKSYVWLGAATVLLVLAGIRGLLVRAREALADATAEHAFGRPALETAEKLVIGRLDATAASASTLDRASALERLRSRSAFALDYLLFGAIATAMTEYTLGAVHFLAGGHPGPAELVANALFRAAGLMGTIVPLQILIRDRMAAPAAMLAVGPAMLCLAVGATLAHVGLQTLPLVLVSTLMPDGMDMVFKHEVGVLVRTVLFGTFTSASVDSLFALVAAVASVASGSWAIGFLCAALWVVASSLETMAPRQFEGIAAIAVCAAVLAPVALIGLRRLRPFDHRPVANALALAPLVLAAAAHWLGYGDINHLAAASSKAAVRWEADGDIARARQAWLTAARRSSWHADGWLALSDLEVRHGNSAAALLPAERAVLAPLTSDWGKQAMSAAQLGQVLLAGRGPGEVERARAVLETVAYKSRRSSRLPPRVVGNALYNLAAANALLGARRIDVLLLLLEALAADRSLAAEALKDADFASVHLAIAPSLQASRQQVTAALAGREWTVDDFRDVVKTHAVAPEAVADVVAAIVVSMARRTGSK